MLLPFCTAGLSLIWTLGFLGVMGIPINIMTSIVPALVVVIGSTEDIHLLAEYAAGIRVGQERSVAIRRMADNTGLAVLLTFVTTYVGFLSIALNDIELLKQFGLAASTGLLFNFIITVLLVPVILCRFGHRRPNKPQANARLSLFQRLAIGLMLRLRKHRSLVFSAAAILTDNVIRFDIATVPYYCRSTITTRKGACVGFLECRGESPCVLACR